MVNRFASGKEGVRVDGGCDGGINMMLRVAFLGEHLVIY